MPRYFAADVHDGTVIIHGSGETYTEAMDVHARRLALGARRSDYWRPAVLLDLASTDPSDVEEMLLHDPVLRSIFELGRQSAARSENAGESDGAVSVRFYFSDADPVAECECGWRMVGDAAVDAFRAWWKHRASHDEVARPVIDPPTAPTPESDAS